MRLRIAIAGTAGVVLTVVGAALVFIPQMMATLEPVVSISGTVEGMDASQLLLVLGVMVGSYATWSARRGKPRSTPTDEVDARFEAMLERPPEIVQSAAHVTVGTDFDGQVADAIDGNYSAHETVQEVLVQTAIQTHRRIHDCSHEEAARAVGTGEWTDDRLAGAYVGGSTGPSYSLWARLRGWLDPIAERERRIHRTIDAIQNSVVSRWGDRS